jgi:hypothetical protein
MRLDRACGIHLCDAAPLFENLNAIGKQYVLTGNLFSFESLAHTSHKRVPQKAL